jgi:ferric-dicitrate binding protein FerR (iron transport regulator)
MIPESYKYLHFSEADFMNDPFFQDWIIHPDKESMQFWEGFLERFPEKRADVEGAYQFLKNIHFKESFAKNEMIEKSLEEALKIIEAKDAVHSINKVKTLFNFGWAAAVVLVLVSGLWFFSRPSKTDVPQIAVTPSLQDIAPGGNKAILTLADGSRVILDSVNNGAITTQGNVIVVKLDDGQLAYETSDQNSQQSVIQYNIISTPRGGQYQIVLADGSKVWLNAESSLKFPTRFEGKDRKVEILGEGYFEIAHNKSKPFMVSNGNMVIEVLGTHFNVNAYQDEDKIKVTLLEGSVNVLSNGEQLKIKPGQQADIKNGLMTLNQTVNVEEVMAWKNGKFYFEKADIKTVMKQIVRWYNVDVEYRGNVNHHFGGDISRNVPVSRVFEMLELTGGVKFKIEGKKVLVMP